MIEDIKLVYAFNLLTGEYEGPKTLDNTDRSPISGAWQIPCNMVEVAPPEIQEGHKCLWDGTQWIIKEVEKPKEPEIPEATHAPEKPSQTPSLSERIAVLEDAVNTLMEGVATNG
jgi:hypothetical protein|nr:MAG TPA: hypothetical protein [Caudoviricetes sp.]